MKKFISLFAIIAIFATVAMADVAFPDKTPKPKPTPKPKKQTTAYFSVIIDQNATDAKIEIPKELLKTLNKQVAETDNENLEDNTAAVTFEDEEADKIQASSTKVQTVMFGALLSLSFILGGLWMVRSKKVNKTTTVVIVTALISISATTILANVAPPIIRKVSSALFSDDVKSFKRGGGDVKVVVSSGNRIILTVPVDEADKNPQE